MSLKQMDSMFSLFRRIDRKSLIGFDYLTIYEKLFYEKKRLLPLKDESLFFFTCYLYVETEENDVSVFNNIFFAFHTDKTLFFCGIVVTAGH